jgi:hypothetical protein
MNKIAIVTVENRTNQKLGGYLEYHNQSFSKYASNNNYDYLFLNECSNNEKVNINDYWCKIYKVLEILKTNKYNYVMWVDSDTIITDYNKSLESFISKFGDKDIIIGLDCWEKCNSLHQINSGVFIIKNSEVGKRFLQDCIDVIDSKSWCINSDNSLNGPWAGECYEQGVMNQILLFSNKYTNNTYIDRKQELIYNYSSVKPNYYNSPSLIVHLCGVDSKKRTSFFSNLI